MTFLNQSERHGSKQTVSCVGRSFNQRTWSRAIVFIKTAKDQAIGKSVCKHATSKINNERSTFSRKCHQWLEKQLVCRWLVVYPNKKQNHRLVLFGLFRRLYRDDDHESILRHVLHFSGITNQLTCEIRPQLKFRVYVKYFILVKWEIHSLN